jgi:hypothetical protein
MRITLSVPVFNNYDELMPALVPKITKPFLVDNLQLRLTLSPRHRAPTLHQEFAAGIKSDKRLS